MTPSFSRCFAALLLLLAVVIPEVSAEVKLHPVLCDNAVLQRDVALPIFGTGTEGEELTVTFNGELQRTAVRKGVWAVVFKAMKASSRPLTLEVRGANTLTVRNILLGDVWICAGQSNMASPLEAYVKKAPHLFKDIPGSSSNNEIRLIKIKVEASSQPEPEPNLDPAFPNWRLCDPEAALLFSATGYFFGKHLQPHVQVPIGLIAACQGATAAECWTPWEVLESDPRYRSIVKDYRRDIENFPRATQEFDEKLKAWNEKHLAGGKRFMALPPEVRRSRPKPPQMSPDHLKRPSGLYNRMIASLHRFPIKGVIWYQGESNCKTHTSTLLYRSLLPDLIKSWRAKWGLGDFPFYWVQLAGFGKILSTAQDGTWSWMREGLDQIQRTVPNGAMASAIDGGMQDDIHPPYKELVGSRLALLARRLTYGENVACFGPSLAGHSIADGKVSLVFNHCGSGLVLREPLPDHPQVRVNADELKGFTLCGKDRKFVPAKARLTGKETVEVWSDSVKDPVAVRYAWAGYPVANLYNPEGLPAPPFRTDTFPPPKTGIPPTSLEE